MNWGLAVNLLVGALALVGICAVAFVGLLWWLGREADDE